MNHPDESVPAAAVLTLLEAGRRAARGGVPRSVLLLHLGRLACPKPHHGRVARAILIDVAERLEGEVVRLPGGDLALLCRRGRGAPEQIGPHAPGKDGLPAVLTRLFGSAALTDRALFTTWRLPEQAEQLRVHLERPAPAPPPPSGSAPVASVAALLRAAVGSALIDPRLLRRQTAVRLRTAGGARSFDPCFREITAPLGAPDAWTALPHDDPTGVAPVDPFLLRELCASRDAAVLNVLCRHLADGRNTDGARAVSDPGVALHVNLTLAGVLSPAFTRLADLCRSAATRLGVELAFAEVVGARDEFAAARARLRDVDALLVLDEVSPTALTLSRPAGLGADLIKLEWDPALDAASATQDQMLQDAVAAIGAARIVLQGADTEAAIAWGRQAGITLFQGRHIDAMLAAGRIAVCTHAGLCALRECIDRAIALDAIGRAGCHDRALLDTGLRAMARRATA